MRCQVRSRRQSPLKRSARVAATSESSIRLHFLIGQSTSRASDYTPVGLPCCRCWFPDRSTLSTVSSPRFDILAVVMATSTPWQARWRLEGSLRLPTTTSAPAAQRSMLRLGSDQHAHRFPAVEQPLRDLTAERPSSPDDENHHELRRSRRRLRAILLTSGTSYKIVSRRRFYGGEDGIRAKRDVVARHLKTTLAIA